MARRPAPSALQVAFCLVALLGVSSVPSVNGHTISSVPAAPHSPSTQDLRGLPTARSGESLGATAGSEPHGSVGFPAGWTNVDTLSVSGDSIVLAGQSSTAATLGILSTSSGTFTDESSLLPSGYSYLGTSGLDGSQVLLGGAESDGSAALGSLALSPLGYTDLTNSLGGSGWGFDVNAVSFGGGQFLVGGASNGFTPLSLYDPSTNSFDSLTSEMPYYFATNGNVWTGSEWVMGGAKAYYLNTEALGTVGTGGAFTDASGALPGGTAVVGRVGWNGAETLISATSTSNVPEEFLWTPGAATASTVTSDFPGSATIGAILGWGSDYLVGGSTGSAGLLGIFYPGNGTFHNIPLPALSACTGIAALAFVGTGVAWGGTDGGAEACFGLMGVPTSSFDFLDLAGFLSIPATIQVGGTSMLEAIVSSGVPPLAYSYSNLPPGCASADLAYLNCTPTAPGVYSGVRVTVTDGLGETATDQATVFVANPQGQLALYDDQFSSDTTLSTPFWSASSPTWPSILAAEAGAGEFSGQVMQPTLPLSFSGGLSWQVAGAGSWAGLSTSWSLTPPASFEVVATPDLSHGGNPIVACLSSPTAAPAFCVFISPTGAFTQVQTSTPSPLTGAINVDDEVTLWLNVTATSTSVFLGTDGQSSIWSGTDALTNTAFQLSLGSYAGSVPGETEVADPEDTATFQTVEGISAATFSAQVVGTDTWAGGSGAASSLSANLTSAWSGSTVGTAFSWSSNTAAFVDLPSDQFLLVSSQSAPQAETVVYSGSLETGDATDPSAALITDAITFAVPTIAPVTVAISEFPDELTSPQPFTASFTAIASGGTWSYDYQGLVSVIGQGGVPEPGGSFSYDFAQPDTYEVYYSVACRAGSSWFGQTCASGASASLNVAVLGGTVDLTLTPVAGSTYLQLSYNGVPGDAEVNVDPSLNGGTDVLEVDLTAQFTGVLAVNLPPWLESFLGISSPYYSVAVTVSQCVSQPLTTTTAYTVQLGVSSTTDMIITLPGGTPTSTNLLQDCLFEFDISPTTEAALIQDVIGIVGALAGLVPTTPGWDTVVESLVTTSGTWAGSTLATFLQLTPEQQTAALAGMLPTVVQQLISAATALGQASILSHLDTLGAGAGLGDSEASSPALLGDFAYDGITLAASILHGDFTQTDAASAQPLESISMSSSGGLVAATLSTSAGTFGYTSSGWVEGNLPLGGVFLHTPVANDSYEFALGLPNVTSLGEVAVSSTTGSCLDYTLMVSDGGAYAVTTGQACSKPADYTVGGNTTALSLHAVAAPSTSPEGAPLVILTAAVVGVLAANVALWLLHRRRPATPRSGSPPANPPTAEEKTPANAPDTPPAPSTVSESAETTPEGEVEA